MGSGGGNDHKDGLYCFAEEAFIGMPNHTIKALRLWRDEARVGNSAIKKMFINFYYAHICHPAGKLLRTMPILKPLARRGILLFVKANNIVIKAD